MTIKPLPVRKCFTSPSFCADLGHSIFFHNVSYDRDGKNNARHYCKQSMIQNLVDMKGVFLYEEPVEFTT